MQAPGVLWHAYPRFTNTRERVGGLEAPTGYTLEELDYFTTRAWHLV